MRRRQTHRGAYSQTAMPWLRGLTTLLLAAAVPSPLHAHGFGQRYDLPVPLWLYLLGAGAMVGRSIVLAVRIAAVVLFALVVIAGLIGNQSPFKNIAPVMVWVIGWVGL